VWTWQSLLQVLKALIDPTLRKHSHGYRAWQRSTDAVRATRWYVHFGKRVALEVDVAEFFGRVIHDILMSRAKMRINDAAVSRLIRAYLKAGIMAGSGVRAGDDVAQETVRRFEASDHRSQECGVQRLRAQTPGTLHWELIALGPPQSVAKQVAANCRCWRCNSDPLRQPALPTAHFDRRH
jgi:hypothetical protein